MKLQLLLAEETTRIHMKSFFIVFEATVLRNSKHNGFSCLVALGFSFIFFFFFLATLILKPHSFVDSCPRSHSNQLLPNDKKKYERTLLTHTVIYFKAHSSYINIYINIFLFITNTRQALVILSAFVLKTKKYFHGVVK